MDRSAKDPMSDHFGFVFLVVLSLLFGSYGLRELALAYRVKRFDEWFGMAWLGAGSLVLCSLFAICSYSLTR